MNKIVILVCIIFGAILNVSSQKDTTFQDVIRVKNGFAFLCKIIDFDEHGIKALKNNGDTLFFGHKEVNVIQHTKLKIDNKTNYDFIGQKWYGTLDFGFAPINNNDYNYGYGKKSLLGGISIIGGARYKLFTNSNHDYWRLNAGVYEFSSYKNLGMGVFSTGYQWNILNRKITPYLSVDAGYGFAFPTEDAINERGTTIKIKGGGNHYSIGTGVFVHQFKGFSFSISGQYTIQRASITETYVNSTNITDLTLRRIFIKFGLIF